jgi:hypothetical protein
MGFGKMRKFTKGQKKMVMQPPFKSFGKFAVMPHPQMKVTTGHIEPKIQDLIKNVNPDIANAILGKGGAGQKKIALDDSVVPKSKPRIGAGGHGIRKINIESDAPLQPRIRSQTARDGSNGLKRRVGANGHGIRKIVL